MSGIGETAAGVGIIKSLFDVAAKISGSKADYFEKVIRPLHGEAEAAVTDYYKLFYLILEQVQRRDVKEKSLPQESTMLIEQAYRAGKARRDLIRALCSELSTSSKHSRVRSYSKSVIEIFSPVLEYQRGMSAGRFCIAVAEFCTQEVFQPEPFFEIIIKTQIELTENRWVSACQLYALLCLHAYR
jgi:hypothetical protein